MNLLLCPRVGYRNALRAPLSSSLIFSCNAKIMTHEFMIKTQGIITMPSTAVELTVADLQKCISFISEPQEAAENQNIKGNEPKNL